MREALDKVGLARGPFQEPREAVDKVGLARMSPSEPREARPDPRTAEAFFRSLPSNELLPGEVALRQAVLDWVNNYRGRGLGPTMSDAGQSRELQQARNSFLPREVTLREWVDKRIGGEIETKREDGGQIVFCIRGSTAKRSERPERQEPVNIEKAEDFLASLPADELTPEESDLRGAILDWVHGGRPDVPLLLGDAAKDRRITTTKTAALPQEVPIRMWIDHRIGGEIETSKDEKGRTIIQLRGRSMVGAGELRDQKEAFFESLPQDGFTAEEEDLRAALLEFLANWRGEESPTLSHAGGDDAVRRGRAAVLKRGTPVSLKEWVDRRIGGEVETVLDGTGQWAIGLRGTVDHEAVARKRSRPHGDMDGKEGKGKGKRPSAGPGRFDRDRDDGRGPPWKSRRLEEPRLRR